MTVRFLIKQAGGVCNLAARLGVSHSTVCGWAADGYIPSGRLLPIAREMNLPVELLAPLVKPPLIRRAKAA